MVRRKRRKKHQARKFRLQLVTFVVGIACSIPAVSFADDLDDVLDDLMTYRLRSKAAEERGEPVQKPQTVAEPVRETKKAAQKQSAVKPTGAKKSDKTSSK